MLVLWRMQCNLLFLVLFRDKKTVATTTVLHVPFFMVVSSLINNQQGTASLKNGTFQVGSKGWDWSLGSIQDP